MKVYRFLMMAMMLYSLGGTQIGQAQINVSEVLQKSSLVTSEENKLYFVDFWATWCGPCIHAKKWLTVLQKQFPNDFHIISISEESRDKVARFINKNPTKLTVAIDNYGETFRSFNIKALPKGILFNAEGEKLWMGHPGDLNTSLITKFLKSNNNRLPLSIFVKEVDNYISKVNNYVPKKALEIALSKSNSDDFQISFGSTHLRLEGKLIQILSYLSKISELQIKIDKNVNKSYTFYIINDLVEDNTLKDMIFTELNIAVTEDTANGEIVNLTIGSPMFWDTDQINWGNKASKYLVSDTDISADNVTIVDLAYQLSKALELPVIVEGSTKDRKSIHDWQVHYKYMEFMKNNFIDYGIEVNKRIADYPIFVITKKAP